MIIKLSIVAVLFAGLTAASLLPRRAGGGMQARLSPECRVDLLYWLSGPTLVAWFVGRMVALALAGVALFVHADVADPWCGFGPVAALPAWPRAALAFLSADFANYWVHRGLHASRTFWPLHAIHHSSRALDWHSALRIHPFDRFVMRLGVLGFLLLLGFPLGALGGAAILAGGVGILVHWDVDVDLGPLRYVIATPRFHRWHHASAAEARGKNLAGIFPVWDLLFGTFHLPRRRAERCGPSSDLPATLRSHLLEPIAGCWRQFLCIRAGRSSQRR